MAARNERAGNPGRARDRPPCWYHLLMNLGFSEMLFIFFLALLIFGPKKLPEIGRQIGEAMTQFKRASNEFKSQLEDEIRNMEAEESRKKIAPPDPPETPEAKPIALETIPRNAPVYDAPHSADTPTNGSGDSLTVPPADPE
jgi:Tat protein translocase TatB subunit